MWRNNLIRACIARICHRNFPLSLGWTASKRMLFVCVINVHWLVCSFSLLFDRCVIFFSRSFVILFFVRCSCTLCQFIEYQCVLYKSTHIHMHQIQFRLWSRNERKTHKKTERATEMVATLFYPKRTEKLFGFAIFIPKFSWKIKLLVFFCQIFCDIR